MVIVMNMKLALKPNVAQQVSENELKSAKAKIHLKKTSPDWRQSGDVLEFMKKIQLHSILARAKILSDDEDPDDRAKIIKRWKAALTQIILNRNHVTVLRAEEIFDLTKILIEKMEKNFREQLIVSFKLNYLPIIQKRINALNKAERVELGKQKYIVGLLAKAIEMKRYSFTRSRPKNDNF